MSKLKLFFIIFVMHCIHIFDLVWKDVQFFPLILRIVVAGTERVVSVCAADILVSLRCDGLLEISIGYGNHSNVRCRMNVEEQRMP